MDLHLTELFIKIWRTRMNVRINLISPEMYAINCSRLLA